MPTPLAPIPTIDDIAYADVMNGSADIVVACLGYEERCTAIPSEIPSTLATKTALVAFAESGDDDLRALNENSLKSKGFSMIITASADSDAEVLDLLNRRCDGVLNPHVVIDYSSMSRMWYNAVLNWARFSEAARGTVTLDFLYAKGEYIGADGPLVLESIDVLPGCEGLTRPGDPSLLCMGLGFDASAIWCAFQELQPHELVCFVADDGTKSDERERVLKVNQELRSFSTLEFDLSFGSVTEAYRGLASVLTERSEGADVSVLPQGAKPHTLATLLLAHRFPDIRCLRIKRRPRVERIRAAEGRVATRVRFERGS